MSQLAILGSILGAFLAIVCGIYVAGRRAGIKSAERDSYARTVTALRREQSAAARAPETKERVIDRLRSGGGL